MIKTIFGIPPYLEKWSNYIGNIVLYIPTCTRYEVWVHEIYFHKLTHGVRDKDINYWNEVDTLK